MPPASSASARLGAGSSSVFRWSNISTDTGIRLAVAHSSSSSRLKRYWPPTYWAGRLRCLIQRVTVASVTFRNLLTSRTVSCKGPLLLWLFAHSWGLFLASCGRVFGLHVLEKLEGLAQVGLEVLAQEVEHLAEDRVAQRVEDLV